VPANSGASGASRLLPRIAASISALGTGSSSDAELRRLAAEVVGQRNAGSNRITAELTGLDLATYGCTL
jgi:hypothetical protein